MHTKIECDDEFWEKKSKRFSVKSSTVGKTHQEIEVRLNLKKKKKTNYWLFVCDFQYFMKTEEMKQGTCKKIIKKQSWKLNSSPNYDRLRCFY